MRRSCARCSRDRFDVDAIAAEAGENATPVIPLVRELRERVGEEYADAVHFGATSQDIVDTAAMLVAQRALAAILTDTRTATPPPHSLPLRTAAPRSSGARCCSRRFRPRSGWSRPVGSSGSTARLANSSMYATRVLAVQMGGPVGSRPPQVAARAADPRTRRAGAAVAHRRTRVAQLAAGLGTLAGAASKAARDVSLLAQTEVGELHEGGAGAADPRRWRTSATRWRPCR